MRQGDDLNSAKGPTARRRIRRAALGLSLLLLLSLITVVIVFSDERYADGGAYMNYQYGFSLSFPPLWQNKYIIEETADLIYIRDRAIVFKYGASEGLLFTLRVYGEGNPYTGSDGFSELGRASLNTVGYRLAEEVNCPANDLELTREFQELRQTLPAMLADTAVLQAFTPTVSAEISGGFSLELLAEAVELAAQGPEAIAAIAGKLPFGSFFDECSLVGDTLLLRYRAKVISEYNGLLLGDLTRHIAAGFLVLYPQLEGVVMDVTEELCLGYTRACCESRYGTPLHTLANDPQRWLDCILAPPPVGRAREVGDLGLTAYVLADTAIKEQPFSSSAPVLELGQGNLLLVLGAAGDYYRVAWTFSAFPFAAGYIGKDALSLNAALFPRARDAYAERADVYPSPDALTPLYTDFRGNLTVLERREGRLRCRLPDGREGWLAEATILFAAPTEDMTLSFAQLAQLYALALVDAFNQDVNLNLGATAIYLEAEGLAWLPRQHQQAIAEALAEASGLSVAIAGRQELLDQGLLKQDKEGFYMVDSLLLSLDRGNSSLVSGAALVKLQKYRADGRYIVIESLFFAENNSWLLNRSVITETT